MGVEKWGMMGRINSHLKKVGYKLYRYPKTQVHQKPINKSNNILHVVHGKHSSNLVLNPLGPF